MNRLNADLTNSLSHPIRHAHGSQQSQLSLHDASTGTEQQCLWDDQYFNQLYRNLDNNYLRSEDLDSHSSAIFDNLRVVSSSLVDNLEFDADVYKCRMLNDRLTRMQQEFNQISSNLNSITEGVSKVQREYQALGDDIANLRMDFDDLKATYAEEDALLDLDFGSDSDSEAPSPDDPPVPNTPRSILGGAENSELILDVVDTVENETSRAAAEPYKCPVCLHCVRQRKPTTTVCGHVFCARCIWTALRNTRKCPVCQQLMAINQIFRIYI